MLIKTSGKVFVNLSVKIGRIRLAVTTWARARTSGNDFKDRYLSWMTTTRIGALFVGLARLLFPPVVKPVHNAGIRTQNRRASPFCLDNISN